MHTLLHMSPSFTHHDTANELHVGLAWTHAATRVPFAQHSTTTRMNCTLCTIPRSFNAPSQPEWTPPLLHFGLAWCTRCYTRPVHSTHHDNANELHFGLAWTHATTRVPFTQHSTTTRTEPCAPYPVHSTHHHNPNEHHHCYIWPCVNTCCYTCPVHSTQQDNANELHLVHHTPFIQRTITTRMNTTIATFWPCVMHTLLHTSRSFAAPWQREWTAPCAPYPVHSTHHHNPNEHHHCYILSLRDAHAATHVPFMRRTMTTRMNRILVLSDNKAPFIQRMKGTNEHHNCSDFVPCTIDITNPFFIASFAPPGPPFQIHPRLFFLQNCEPLKSWILLGDTANFAPADLQIKTLKSSPPLCLRLPTPKVLKRFPSSKPYKQYV